MTNKQLFENAKTPFEHRDVSVQFACWLGINYKFNKSINQFVVIDALEINVYNTHFKHNRALYPARNYVEMLFDYWLTL